jgi:hypothetical protein
MASPVYIPFSKRMRVLFMMIYFKTTILQAGFSFELGFTDFSLYLYPVSQVMTQSGLFRVDTRYSKFVPVVLA